MIKIKKGLNLPISGTPVQSIERSIEQGQAVNSVALLGADYPGLKPTLEVSAGDQVTAGQLLFTDKKTPGVRYTAPATGMVCAINRGARRAFQSIVIDVESDESFEFESYSDEQAGSLSRQQIVDQLIKSGQWTALRTRPYSKVPAPGEIPAAIFVTAMDTRPLAPDPLLILSEQMQAFTSGLDIIARLTEGRVYLCCADNAKDAQAVKGAAGKERPAGKKNLDLSQLNNPAISIETFSGVHPAGLAGTHIHFLEPVHQHKTVWYLGYQDVIAIGHLFKTGRLYFERVVSIAGPAVSNPRLVRTRLGACTDDLLAGECQGAENRVISGSVLDGRTAAGGSAFLGRYHHQISVLPEGRKRELLGLVMPGFEKFSLTRLYMSAFTLLFNKGSKKLDLTTSTGGSERAMVPLGTFEEVMPLDILPTQLLKALLVGDIDSAQALGCLELDEEDLALCAFSCPGKYEYGPYLRDMLTRIEAEG